MAPSPTGFLHLGNAWAFFLAWLGARSQGGRLILRLEDLDPARSRPEYAQAIRRDLAWLGLNWDREVEPQSRRFPVYARVIADFAAQGLVYPCYCTRRELRELAAAPHAASKRRGEAGGLGDLGVAYPGVCSRLTPAQRAALEEQGRRASLRLRYPGQDRLVADAIQGPCEFKAEEAGGDFALRRSDGVFAYQLAVTVDDAEQGVNQVVRGRDILASTPRQLYLLELLGAQAPEYAHLPLVLDSQGERLAKRHNSLRLAALREAGVSAGQVAGWLACLAGLQNQPRPASPAEFVSNFDFRRVPKQDIILTPSRLAGLQPSKN